MSGGLIQVIAPTGAWASLDSLSNDSPAAPAKPIMVVGGGGSGTMLLRSNRAGAAIQEQPGADGAALLVRSNEDGEGTFRGWGTVRLTGPFVQNGRVIADGFGADRTLDFSAAAMVTNTIENPTDGGTNGWFAREGGQLVLPPIKITGEHTYTWGESRRDPVIDLVNSIRFRPHRLRGTGQISISLLDPASDTVPRLPGGLQALALWSLDSSAEFSSLDLLLRYDDSLASSLRMPEQELGLWVYEEGWRPILGKSSGIDQQANLIWGTAAGKPSYFAAAVIPEPWLLPTVGLAGLLLRRRRHGPVASTGEVFTAE